MLNISWLKKFVCNFKVDDVAKAIGFDKEIHMRKNIVELLVTSSIPACPEYMARRIWKSFSGDGFRMAANGMRRLNNKKPGQVTGFQVTRANRERLPLF